MCLRYITPFIDVNDIADILSLSLSEMGEAYLVPSAIIREKKMFFPNYFGHKRRSNLQKTMRALTGITCLVSA